MLLSVLCSVLVLFGASTTRTTATPIKSIVPLEPLSPGGSVSVAAIAFFPPNIIFVGVNGEACLVLLCEPDVDNSLLVNCTQQTNLTVFPPESSNTTTTGTFGYALATSESLLFVSAPNLHATSVFVYDCGALPSGPCVHYAQTNRPPTTALHYGVNLGAGPLGVLAVTNLRITWDEHAIGYVYFCVPPGLTVGETGCQERFAMVPSLPIGPSSAYTTVRNGAATVVYPYVLVSFGTNILVWNMLVPSKCASVFNSSLVCTQDAVLTVPSAPNQALTTTQAAFFTPILAVSSGSDVFLYKLDANSNVLGSFNWRIDPTLVVNADRFNGTSYVYSLAITSAEGAIADDYFLLAVGVQHLETYYDPYYVTKQLNTLYLYVCAPDLSGCNYDSSVELTPTFQENNAGSESGQQISLATQASGEPFAFTTATFYQADGSMNSVLVTVVDQDINDLLSQPFE